LNKARSVRALLFLALAWPVSFFYSLCKSNLLEHCF